MKTQWLVLLLLSLCGAAHADRDIVYSARYYTPPGSHRTSYFHLYRINPNGTGKTQLTFGIDDEEFPKWSSDSKQIMFVVYPANSSLPMLCRVNADGKNRRRLGIVKEDAWPLKLAVSGYRVEDVDMANGVSERHTLINLKTGRRLTIRTDEDTFPELLPMPGCDLVYADNIHNSTVGTDYLFCRLNPSRGTLRYLTEGQFLAWSPDGSRFCTAPGRDITSYERRRYSVMETKNEPEKWCIEDENRMVWSAPLYVRAAGGGKMRQLTSRLSWVTFADWRKEK